jgi:ADP-ribosyl-[dinitrogen reductase] hydrolase
MRSRSAVDILRGSGTISPIRVVEVVPANNKGGWVAISLAPGKKTQGTYVHWDRDLATDLNGLKDWRVTTLVPFLTDDELKRLKIPNLIEVATERDFVVQRFPFHDGGIPENMAEAVQFVKDVIERFHRGERLLKHCNGGLGRAGTMAACVRLALKLDTDPEAAIASVREFRGERAIETMQQEHFVARFATQRQT